MPERWSEETFNAALAALEAFAEGWNGEPDGDRDAVHSVLTALAGRGALVEPGGETRVGWAIRGVHTGWTRTFTTREAAEHYLSLVPAGEFELVTIRTTWVQPTDAKEPSP